MALDRHCVRTRQPFAAGLDQSREQPRDVVRPVDPLRRERRPETDLDAEVGAREAAEGVLVGHVVADEDRGRRPDLVAERVERVALVGLDDRQLDDLLASARMHAGQQCRALAHGRECRGGVLSEASR